MKLLAIFKEVPLTKIDDEKVKTFFLKVYKLYRKELYQPFENALEENKFSKKFHILLDTLVHTSSFR